MNTYICTYDLIKETTRPPIVEEIQKTGAYAMLSESSYAIHTSESVEEVYGRLSKHLDSNDRCLVLTLRAPFDGQHDKDVLDWLIDCLPN